MHYVSNKITTVAIESRFNSSWFEAKSITARSYTRFQTLPQLSSNLPGYTLSSAWISGRVLAECHLTAYMDSCDGKRGTLRIYVSWKFWILELSEAIDTADWARASRTPEDNPAVGLLAGRGWLSVNSLTTKPVIKWRTILMIIYRWY